MRPFTQPVIGDVKPRRARHRPARWLKHRGVRATVVGICAVCAAAAAWHYWVLYSALDGAQSDLLSARAAIQSVDLGVDSKELDAAAADLRSAQRNIDHARAHQRWDPLLRGAAHLPLIGANVSTARALTEIAGDLVEAGDRSITVAAALSEARDAAGDDSTFERAAGTLQANAAEVDRIEVLLTNVQHKRAEIDESSLVGPLRNAIDRLDRDLPALSDSFATVHALSEVVPGMLGFDGERRILVLALNNGELLPGGGLVTASGVVTVNDGTLGDIEFVDSSLWRREWEALGGEYIEPPGPLRRYLLVNFPWNLMVSNWSPDFPAWSRQALEFYEMVHGPQDVGGVLAVDLVTLERLLALTGPVTIEGPGGQITFDEKNAVLELERHTRKASEPGEDRKSVIGDLTSAVLARVQSLPAEDWPRLADVMGDLVGGGHIQAASFDPEEQEALGAIGIDGAIDQSAADYLMVSEASVKGGKLSLIMEREAAHNITIDELGTVHHELQLTLHNPFTEWSRGKDPALVEALMGTGRYGAYIRIFVPKAANGFSVEFAGSEAGLEDQGFDGGRQWVGVFRPIEADSTAQITFRWQLPLQGELGSGSYRLVLQKQPGIRQFCSTVSLVALGHPLKLAGGPAPSEDGSQCFRKDVELSATLEE